MATEHLDLELLHSAAADRIGPPILFVHGGFHGAWCWADHFMPWFSQRGHDCYAVSYREHGRNLRSDRYKEWRLKDYVDDVRWAIDKIGEAPIMIGHSLGGSIVQKLASEGGVAAMILLAPSPIGGSNRAAMRMFVKHPAAMLRGFTGGDLTVALPAFLSFFLSDDLPEASRRAIAQRCDGLTSLKAANDAFYFDTPKPVPLNIPVLVASGEKDWSIPQYKNEKLARRYRGDHIVVPTSHDMMCDTRWEEAAMQVESWLQRQFGA